MFSFFTREASPHASPLYTPEQPSIQELGEQQQLPLHLQNLPAYEKSGLPFGKPLSSFILVQNPPTEIRAYI